MRRVVSGLLVGVVIGATCVLGCGKSGGGGAEGTAKVVDPSAKKADIMDASKMRMGKGKGPGMGGSGAMKSGPGMGGTGGAKGAGG